MSSSAYQFPELDEIRRLEHRRNDGSFYVDDVLDQGCAISALNKRPTSCLPNRQPLAEIALKKRSYRKRKA